MNDCGANLSLTKQFRETYYYVRKLNDDMKISQAKRIKDIE